MGFLSYPENPGDSSEPAYIGMPRPESKSDRQPAQAGGGLVGVKRQDLVADPQVVDVAVARPEVERDVNLVLVVEAEAGRHDDLLVADHLEPLRDGVVAVN